MCWVISKHCEIVGKLACIEVVASLKSYSDVLTIAVANVAIGT